VNSGVIMLTWRKNLSIMNKFSLSVHIPLLDYEIWIGCRSLHGHHSTSTECCATMPMFLLYSDVPDISNVAEI
jgi:hypothetical protein